VQPSQTVGGEASVRLSVVQICAAHAHESSTMRPVREVVAPISSYTQVETLIKSDGTGATCWLPEETIARLVGAFHIFLKQGVRAAVV